MSPKVIASFLLLCVVLATILDNAEGTFRRRRYSYRSRFTGRSYFGYRKPTIKTLRETIVEKHYIPVHVPVPHPVPSEPQKIAVPHPVPVPVNVPHPVAVPVPVHDDHKDHGLDLQQLYFLANIAGQSHGVGGASFLGGGAAGFQSQGFAPTGVFSSAGAGAGSFVSTGNQFGGGFLGGAGTATAVATATAGAGGGFVSPLGAGGLYQGTPGGLYAGGHGGFAPNTGSFSNYPTGFVAG